MTDAVGVSVGIRSLELFVPGRPKTKGSQDWYGPGQVAQSVQGSVQWAIMVAELCRHAWRGAQPLTGAVFCMATYVLPGDPLAARSGDGDKLERNLWDALQPCGKTCATRCKKHSGVISDDVLITDWGGKRRQAGSARWPQSGMSFLVGERRPWPPPGE